MSITQEDRRAFEHVLENFKSDPESAGVVLKVLFTFLKKTTPFPIEIQQEVWQLLENHSYRNENIAVIEELSKCWRFVATVAQEEEVAKTYTTGQLAKLFGVSITTINNWIASGRFVGVERNERNKQARISEHTLWLTPSGEKISVQDVANRFFQNQDTALVGLDDRQFKVERMKYMIKVISHYEEKYGGTYKKIVEQKGDPYVSEDWQWSREGKEWNALLKEIGD